MTDEQTHRIRIKIGQAEFDAEGPRDLVNEQFTAFMEAVKAVGANNPQAESPDGHDKGDEGGQGGEKPPSGRGGGQISDDLLNRVFFDHGDLISLSAIPDTDNQKADSLLLLLYGFGKIKSEPKVTGVTLMKACRQSGVNMDRVDRIIDARADLVMAGGAKRGKRYQLNNKGVQHVEGIIRDML